MPLRYSIVWDDDPEDLHARVTRLIGEGWEPQGGLAVNTWQEREPVDGGGERLVTRTLLYQALIRRD
jgi:hypothetical protein